MTVSITHQFVSPVATLGDDNDPNTVSPSNWNDTHTITGAAALTKVDDTNVTLTLGGSPSTALLAATSITVNWTGTLALGRFAQGADGQLLIGQTSAASQYKTITGDIAITAAGAASVNALHSGALANPSASLGLTATNGTALTAMRSDAAPALSQAIGPTWTGNHTFSPTSGTAIAINPAANTYNRAITSTQTGPTSGSTAGPLAFNSILGTYSATVTGTGVGQDGLNNSNNVLLKVRYVLGGTNWQGQASAAGQFTASVSNGAGNTLSPDAVGLGGSAYINVSNPSTTAGIFGVVPFVYVDNGGSISQAVGSEIDVWVATGGVATQRIGQRIRAQGNLQSSGGIDSAFVVDNFGVAGSAWKSLITISKNGSGIIPLDTAASLFNNDAAMTVANVFNMSTVTVSGNILSFPNAQLTGAGQLGLGVAASTNPLNMSVNSTTANGVALQNTNTGGVASFTATNDTGAGIGDFGVRGSARASYGALVANDGYAYSTTSLTLMADNATGVIRLAAGGNALVGKIGAGLAIGSAAADPGAGIINATNGYRVANVALADTHLVGTAWSTFSPTVTSNTGTITTLGTVTGRSKLVGKTRYFHVRADITTNGTGATYVNFTLPSTPAAFDFFAVGQDLNTGPMLIGHVVASSANMAVTLTSGAYPGVNGSKLVLNGFYEEA